jgi:hypothetical protein
MSSAWRFLSNVGFVMGGIAMVRSDPDFAAMFIAFAILTRMYHWETKK